MLIRQADGQSGDGGGPLGGIGSTLRVYDPGMGAPWVVWAGPVDREFSTLFVRQDGDRIVLDGQWGIGGGDGRRFQWSLSDITPDRSTGRATLRRRRPDLAACGADARATAAARSALSG